METTCGIHGDELLIVALRAVPKRVFLRIPEGIEEILYEIREKRKFECFFEHYPFDKDRQHSLEIEEAVSSLVANELLEMAGGKVRLSKAIDRRYKKIFESGNITIAQMALLADFHAEVASYFSQK